MPLALDPNETIPFSFDSDAHQPPESRPTFELKFLTVRERMKIGKLINRAAEEKEDDAANAAVNEILAIGVVGWRNITGRDGAAVPFDLAAVDDLLTVTEKWRLALATISKTRLAESEKNSLGLPAASAPASHASDALPADALTSPPQNPQS